MNHLYEFRQASQCDSVYPAEIREGDSPPDAEIFDAHQVYGRLALASNNLWASNISASGVNHPYEFRQASQCDGVYP